MPSISMRQWRQISRNLSVPAAPKTQFVAPKGTWVPKAYVWADLANTDYVSIGGREILAGAGAAVNTCFKQLNPGCGIDLYVDNPDIEIFDLGDYYACTKSAAAQIVHVTVFNYSSVKVQVTSA